MRIAILKIIVTIFSLCSLHSIQSAATASTPTKPTRADAYATELQIYFELFRTIKKDCTPQEAYSAILKYKDVIQYPNPSSSPTTEASSSDGACSSSDAASPEEAHAVERLAKSIELYSKELINEYNAHKSVYVLCSLEETCALMLKQHERTEPSDLNATFVHPKASTSLLWPSIKDLKRGTQALTYWHRICQELNPKCTRLQSAKIILMHQIAILKLGHINPDIVSRCSAGLRRQHRLLKKLHKGCSDFEAYAYCIKYPTIMLSESEKLWLRKLQTSDYELIKDLQDEAIRIKDAPEYAKQYKDFLDTKAKDDDAKKIIKGSYKVETLPEMDPSWQKIMHASLPQGLHFFLSNFQECADSPERLKEEKSFFLLHGPPGGGKTAASHLLAMILKRPLLEIRCPGVQTEYQGSAVRNLVGLLAPIFDSREPWIICLDEVDALQKTDRQSAGTSSSKERSQVFSILQQLKDSCKNPNVILVTTTNFECKVPDSVQTRIGVASIEVPLPDYDARRKIAHLLLEKNNILCSPSILDIIARETGGIIPSISTGFSIRGIVDIIYIIKRLLYKQNAKDISTSYTPAFIATPEITYQAIKFNQDAHKGRPTTAEGRYLRELMESPHFWPMANLLSSTACSAAGLVFQAVGETRAQREELRSEANQKIQIASLQLTKKSGEHQAEVTERHTSRANESLFKQLVRSLWDNPDHKMEDRGSLRAYEEDMDSIVSEALEEEKEN